jgi:WD40 repeat protein/uncharacterized caspase-like protein
MKKITLTNFAEASMFQLISRGAVSILPALTTAVLLMYGIARAQEPSRPTLLIQNEQEKRVESIAFSPDGKMLASGNWDSTLKLWDVSSGQLIRSFVGHDGQVWSVAFSSDGKMLASVGNFDHTIKLWDVGSGRLIRSLAGDSSSIAFSPDGKMLASASVDKTVKFWDVSSGRLIRSFVGHSNGVVSVAFSPDGKTLASGSGSKMFAPKLAPWSTDKTVKLWDVGRGNLIRSFKGHSIGRVSVAFSPNGKWLASGSDDKTLNLWDVSSGRLIRSFRGHSDSVNSVAFSPDGKTLASGSSDNNLKLWDVSSGSLIRTLEGHSSRVRSVAFSPGGKVIASGSVDATVKIWSTDTGNLLVSLSDFKDGAWIAFTPDNYYVSSAGAAKYISWRVGNQVYDEAQFKSRFNQPAVIASRLSSLNTDAAQREVAALRAAEYASRLSSLNTAPKDTSAPKLVITSPPVTRGVGPRSTTGRITIKGQALDDSGVREVVAQGVAARLDAQGNFSAEVPLVTGDNRITVTATDIHGNQASENISIRREPEMAAPSGKYVALLIGNNAYQHLGQLKTAVNDAEKVAGLLREFYGFETKVLLNAGREKIITAINEHRRSLTDQDRLVIYYAGHGIFDREVNKAYWLPVDARETDNANWISADDVTTNIRGIRARHVLIISDSCYSGAIVRETPLRLTTPAERERYIEKMMQGNSRILMASGGNEPVEDGGGGGHSVFANALLRGLRQMDAPVFTAEELFFRFVKEPVAGKSDQTPEYSPLRNSGHESGGFVFIRRK